jgi:hypothetical protein
MERLAKNKAKKKTLSEKFSQQKSKPAARKPGREAAAQVGQFVKDYVFDPTNPVDYALLSLPLLAKGAQVGIKAAKNATPKLYHGSTYPFKKGDVVQGFRDTTYGPSATPDFNFAKRYADNRAMSPQELERGFSPNVYKVKPIGKAINYGFHDGKEYNALGGYLVKGKATGLDKAMFEAKQKALKGVKEAKRIVSRKKKPAPWGDDEKL